jgi:hypothetical protein
MPQPKDRPLLEATLEGFEVVVDALMKDEVLASIPFIGTAVKLCKAVDDIRNRAFATKLARFVTTLSSAEQETKGKWRRRVAESPEEAQKVGETLFFVLERLTDLDKPALLSQLFTAFVDEVISGEELRRLAQAIDACFADDLKRLLESTDVPAKSDEPWLRYMAKSGLTQIVAGETWDEAGQLFFEISPLGHKLRQAYSHARRGGA